jgi:uncharacterized tellurite resistance protein B-like protein
MAAAHADPLQTEKPYDIVCVALQKMMGAGYLLTEMGARLEAFAVDDFDLEATVAALELSDETEKRQLLELVSAVHAADDILAEEEDDFLQAVADALGLRASAYSDLTLDIEDRTSLYEARNSLLGPPPLPKN